MQLINIHFKSNDMVDIFCSFYIIISLAKLARNSTAKFYFEFCEMDFFQHYKYIFKQKLLRLKLNSSFYFSVTFRIFNQVKFCISQEFD